ncbi:ATP synthase subunit I [Candidatus Auribacterota bacterium]
MDLRIEKEIKKIKRILSFVLLTIVLFLCPLLIYLKRVDIALGLLLGACIGTTNLSLLIWSGKKMLAMSLKQVQKFSMLMSFIRLFLFALGFAVAVINHHIEPVITIMTAFIIYQQFAFREVLRQISSYRRN